MSAGRITALVIALVILISFITIVRIRTKNKKKDRKLTIYTKEKKEQPKKQKDIVKVTEEQKSQAPSTLEPIMGFIQAGLASGDSEKTIKKALHKSGWNRKQINQAFKNTKT